MSKLVPPTIEPFQEAEVRISIQKLHRNKAADKFGLIAEHLKYASDLVWPLTAIFNGVLREVKLPSAFREGIITPLLKKANKSKHKPTNYRGITIISIMGKLLEAVLVL